MGSLLKQELGFAAFLLAPYRTFILSLEGDSVVSASIAHFWFSARSAVMTLGPPCTLSWPRLLLSMLGMLFP